MAERQAGGGFKLTKADRGDKAKQERAKQLVRDREARRQQVEAELWAEVASPREAQFAQDIETAWIEASWMLAIPRFPNGKPFAAQHPVKLQMWSRFMAAMNERAYKADSSPPLPEEPKDPWQ